MTKESDPQTYAIIGAAMEVHGQLGKGFLEAVYHDALEIEFGLRGIPYEREISIPIVYKSKCLNASYRCDFLCYESIIVELKAESKSTTIDDSQVINYLKATNLNTGLLLNFGCSSLEKKRYVRSTS